MDEDNTPIGADPIKSEITECDHDNIVHVDAGWAYCEDCKTVLEIHWDVEDNSEYYVEPTPPVKPWWVRKCERIIDEDCTGTATHTVFGLDPYMIDCCLPCAGHADSHSTVEPIDEGGA